MTRLTISVTGDPLTFRPVTSSITRQSKDGIVDVVILLFGTEYNISMDGILQLDSTGDIEPATQSVGVNGGFLELKAEQFSGGSTVAKLISTFSSFTYFYPGLSIRGHLKMSETAHAVAVPEFEGHYHFKDLLSGDELIFRLVLDELNLIFEMVEIVDTVETVVYTEALGVGVDEKHFQFVFLEKGKSKLYTFTNYKTQTQARTRKWIGNLKAKIGECNVSVHHHNAEQVLKTVSSDYLFLEYQQIFMKFDRTSNDRFIGQVKMFDDMNTAVEDDWLQIRSRDYKFIGNRVLENGMIRVVMNSVDPNMEIWGWNYEALVPIWEKVLTILVDSDSGAQSLKIQNIVFEYLNLAQVKCDINFGTSVYSFIMTRGDPYITLLSTDKLKFKIQSDSDRFIADFKNQKNGYTLKNSDESGNPLTKKATGTATCVSCVAGNTFTINGIVYTGVTGVKADNTEFSVDTGNNETATDLADSISNDIRVGTDDIDISQSAIAVANVVTITAEAGGVSGNSITMSENSTTITLSGATLTGGAATGGTSSEVLSGFSLNDNWFGIYNTAVLDEVVGFVSNMIQPDSINIAEMGGKLEYEFTYPVKGNIFGVGVLPSFPANLVGGVPFPFVVGTQDNYVKWRANEAVLSFRELETIKRR